jgi:hypothetical protein
MMEWWVMEFVGKRERVERGSEAGAPTTSKEPDNYLGFSDKIN